MNSVNVRLFAWTNLRFSTLLSSITGAICFCLALILLLLQILGYLYLFLIIRESKNYESAEKVIDDEPIHLRKKVFSI